MKLFHELSRWGILYLLVILMIVACIWETNLAIMPIDHMILVIVILAVFFIVVNHWVTFHETNLMVSQAYLEQMDEKAKKIEIAQEKKSRLEKTK